MRCYVDASPDKVCYVLEVNADTSTTHVRGLVPTTTNNRAEYMAILTALRENPDTGLFKITEILFDSQLVVRQLNHQYSIKNSGLRALAIEVWELAKGEVKFIWIPREHNKAGKVLG